MNHSYSTLRTASPNKPSLRSVLERALLATVRLYTYHTPINKGKYWLQEKVLLICAHLPDRIAASTKDGRKLSANLSSGMATTLYFLGEYEPALTKMIATLVREGDVCLDVGANFGWYTSLFHKYCGEKGQVHAFEPIAESYVELCETHRLMNRPSNVFVNNGAVGDEERDIEIYTFADLPTGYASLAQKADHESVVQTCSMVTADSYLDEKGVDRVDFVKVDIEGAELMFLKGGESLFNQSVPPIFVMEMALQQTSNFGYRPNDLLKFFRQRAQYDFYSVNEFTHKIRKIESFAYDDIGANVFCISTGISSGRKEQFMTFLDS